MNYYPKKLHQYIILPHNIIKNVLSMANYGVATKGMILFTKCLRYIHICGILHYSAATRNSFS